MRAAAALESALRLRLVMYVGIDARAHVRAEARPLRLVPTEQVAAQRLDEESLGQIFGILQLDAMAEAHVRIDRRPVHRGECVLRARTRLGVGAADAAHEREMSDGKAGGRCAAGWSWRGHGDSEGNLDARVRLAAARRQVRGEAWSQFDERKWGGKGITAGRELRREPSKSGKRVRAGTELGGNRVTSYFAGIGLGAGRQLPPGAFHF